jgi:diguanylate cyclase (GGDEF)-like protein/PAS domain S-box-containing protein
MQAGRLARFTQIDGLPATTIFQTLEDDSGGLWLTGKWGVARVPKSEMEQAAGGRHLSSVKIFGTYDGLAVAEVTGVSESYRAPDGTLWFPTPGGAARVDPARLRKNERAPGVLVEQVVVDDEARPATTSSMKLPPGVRKLEFDYTALSFVAPQQVRFRYRLDGFDDTWVDGGTRRIAYYTNLPPGRYNFHVQASNEDGVWNNAGASLPFVLEPHFWQSEWFFILLVLTLLAAGAVAYTIRIATVRRAVESREREESRQRVTQILESITDAFVAIDRAWKFTYVNHTAENLLGMPRSKLLGRSCWEVLPEALETDIELELRRAVAERITMRCESRLASGARPWIEIHAYPAVDGVALYFADITLRKEAEEALRSQTLHDDLTGVYNRRGLLALAEQQVRSAERSKRGFDVVFIDLDGLKQINDTFGHPVGDQALIDTADMLRRTFRESDVLSRLGGDEFAVLVLDEKGGGVDLALKRLQDAIEEHNSTGGRPYRLAISTGYCRFDPAAPKPVWELLNAADRVMYGDKRDKRVIR